MCNDWVSVWQMYAMSVTQDTRVCSVNNVSEVFVVSIMYDTIVCSNVWYKCM